MEPIQKSLERLHAIVEGRVQGVGFRYFVEENALALNLDGWVRNLWDGKVEMMVEGERDTLEKLLAAVRRGPRAANVTHISADWQPATGEFFGFRIRPTA